MSGNFTKCKWSVRGNAVGAIDNSNTQSNGMMNVVAYIDMFDFPDNWKSNAELISAAPEMHKILTDINCAIQNSSNETELADAVVSLCHNIEEALSKSKGH